jgi:hypothetical protein
LLLVAALFFTDCASFLTNNTAPTDKFDSRIYSYTPGRANERYYCVFCS